MMNWKTIKMKMLKWEKIWNSIKDLMRNKIAE